MSLLLAGIAFLSLGACGSGSGSGSEASSYCADLGRLVRVLDDGGTDAAYNRLLGRVAQEAPADHAPTWRLMSKLSRERFTYDNFNPAVDSLDRISDDLDAQCPGLGRLIVDNDGRMRLWTEE